MQQSRGDVPRVSGALIVRVVLLCGMLLGSGAWAVACPEGDTGAGNVGGGAKGKQMVILFVDADRPSGQPTFDVHWVADGNGRSEDSAGSWQQIVNVDHGASVRATNRGSKGTLTCYYKLSLMGPKLDIHQAGPGESCQSVWTASQS